MNKYNVTFFVFFLFFLSCNHTNQFKSSFPNKEKLQADYILPGTFITPMFFLIQGNYLCTYSLKKDTMIDMFSLPNLLHEKSFGTRGRGPDEFQSFPWPCQTTNDKIYIRGYTPLVIKQFNIDSCANITQENEFILNEHETFGSMHIIQDSLLVYISMGYQNDSKQQITIKKINLNYKRKTGEILIPTESQNASIDPNRGGISVNDSFIVYFYVFRKQIDIYDVRNMKLLKRLGNNKKTYTNTIFEENVSQYVSVYAGKKYFYALFNKKGNKLSIVEPATQTIEVFDYNGNAVVEYSFDDYISIFAVDELNHLLYVYDETNEDFILKYSLPEIN